MDRHDVSDTVTAENVAQLHQEDLKVQQQFDCRGLTYWFDDKRKTAFCLVEAPSKDAIQKMHNHAHGEVPNRIIEVEPNIVESFLGRIEDPVKAQNYELNIINDPAFRTIMVVVLNRISIREDDSSQLEPFFIKYKGKFNEIINRYEGTLVKQLDDYFLVSFKSVSKAIQSALQVQSEFKAFMNGFDDTDTSLKIGLSTGLPVTDKESLFEDTIKLAERMCFAIDAEISGSSEIRELFESENLNATLNSNQVFSLTQSDEKFLSLLFDFTEKTWSNINLKVDDFSKPLGYSKSRLYRKMNALTGKSPNTFIKEYRLNKALKLLTRQAGNVSEVAFDTGFSSPSYFSKCFQKRFGVSPTSFLGHL